MHVILIDHFLSLCQELMLVCVWCILAIPRTVVESLVLSSSEVFRSQEQTPWDQDE